MTHSSPLRRVAIVSGAFDADYSYQENIWAEVLARRGLEVTVYTAGPDRRSSQISTNHQSYGLESFPFRGSSTRQLYLARGVADAVAEGQPEVILWFGPPQLFGRDLVDHTALNHTPLIVFMGQNRRMQGFTWWGRGVSAKARAKALSYRLLRVPTMVSSCRRAHVVVTNTAETADIVLGFLPRRHRAAVAHKIAPTPLGYDESVFSYLYARRARERANLNLEKGAIVAVASSRFAPDKAETIRFNFSALTAALSKIPELVVLMVGAGTCDLSREIRAASKPYGERIRVEPFAGREALSDLFHASDLALFSRPSISCQEALGTGAYGLFADDGSMSWLLDDPTQGRLFSTGDSNALTAALVATCREIDFEHDARSLRALRAGRLSYEKIVDGVLGHVGLVAPLAG